MFYLSQMKTVTAKIEAATTAPLEIPPLETILSPEAREFTRLPPVGQRCPLTGMSRAALNFLILPTPANEFKPPVKSFCLRQKGAKTGIRLISWPSLKNYILAHAEGGKTSTEIAE